MHKVESSDEEVVAPRGPASWKLNIHTGQLQSSEARARLMGYDPSAVQPSAAWWDRMLHPNERLAVNLARARPLQGIDSGYRSEYRAQRQDGQWLWLLEIGCIVRDAQGNAAAVEGIVIDISIDREAQFRVQQQMERLSTIFDYTHQFTGLLSPEGILLEINRSALKAEHRTRRDVLGKPVWELPMWAQQSAVEVARLRDGIVRAGRGEFVRFQLQAADSGAATRRIVDFSLLPLIDDHGSVVSILSEGRDVTDIVSAQQALRALEDRLAVAASTANLGLWEVDLSTGSAWNSERCATMLGYEPNQITNSVEQWLSLLHPDDVLPVRALMQQQLESGGEFRAEYRMRARDGSWRWIHTSGRNVAGAAGGSAKRIAGVQLDVTERKEAEIRRHISERLESVGKLAAGVAHEINTPVQFVSDSVYFVRDGVNELLALADRLRALALRDPVNLAAVQALNAHLPYLVENLPKALERSLDGLTRVSEIVKSMRELAHPDRPDMSEVDLNHVIQNALVVARSEYKYVADVDTEFGELPPLWCHGGELNQVIINLIINASHAIADVVAGTGTRGLIRVATRMDGDSVHLSVGDSGGGIAENIRHRVFEPFFTTKDVGRGTGQGLAISHNIIVKRHGGAIDFDSTPGRGTVFHIRLPRDCRAAPLPAERAA